MYYHILAKQRLKYKGNEDLLWCLKKLEETSTTTGLSPDQITTLVDAAASGVQSKLVNSCDFYARLPRLNSDHIYLKVPTQSFGCKKAFLEST